LKELGYVDIKVECVEINPFMIERAKELAIAGNVAENMIFMEADFNNLKLDRKYAAVIAHQSLHHVVELENLFDVVKTNIDPNGYFITSDMVGRNGHMRWPKALAVVNELWESLEPNYKYNHMQGRQEEIFINHDCSNEGFEGVRAQDIVPLLLNRFNFELFIGFGNIIFPFVDRCFGHNFEPDNLSDKQFIDKVHRIDENLMVSGQINPTQMLAALKVNEVNSVKFSRGISPFNYI
jgi:SAM-dependent methyltransferase